MFYKVKEIFKSIQGEGYHVGKEAVFVRFTGCNLWNGKTQDKKSAICNFCDTDFVGTNGKNGGIYNLKNLIEIIDLVWSSNFSNQQKFVILTGGEPLLQVNNELVEKLKRKNFFVAIETNGTIKPPEGIDWICVSPKVNTNTILKSGNEIKLVYPQKGINLKYYENLNFDHFFLQPLYNKQYQSNLKKTLKTIMRNPKWKLSLQTHKYIGIN